MLSIIERKKPIKQLEISFAINITEPYDKYYINLLKYFRKYIGKWRDLPLY